MKTSQRDSGLIVGACILLVGLVIGISLVRGGSVRPSGTETPVGPPLKNQGVRKTGNHALSFIANVSAYCPCELCCGIYADGITASGHVIQPGDKFVAAPPEYPFGTMLDIPGYGLVPVLDRGGAIKGDRIDTFHDTHESALQWGRKRLTVTVKGD